MEKKEMESNFRMRNSFLCCSVSFPFKHQQSISGEREREMGEVCGKREREGEFE